MAFPRNPFDDAIQQLIQGVENIRAGQAQRFQGQREERMVGEERQFITGRDEAANAFQLQIHEDNARRQQEQFNIQREDQLTRDALLVNQNRVNALGEFLFLLPDDDPNRALATQVMAAIEQRSALRGDAAMGAATSAWITITNEDGEEQQVNLWALTNDVRALGSEMARSQEFVDERKRAIASVLGNETVDPAYREQYYRANVANNPFWTNLERDSLLASIGVVDEEARQRIITEGKLREGDLVTQQLQQEGLRLSNHFQFMTNEEFTAFKGLRYEEAIERLRGLKQTNSITAAEAFTSMGLLPDSGSDRAALARRLGYADITALEEAGRARYQSVQDMMKLEENLMRDQRTLLGLQIDQGRTAVLRDQLLYDRERTFGQIKAGLELHESAMAMALNGDVEGLMRMQAMAQVDPTLGPAMATIRFDTLIERARGAFTHDQARMEYERMSWDRLLRNADIDWVTNRETLLTTMATSFAGFDGIETETNPISPLRQQLEGFVGRMSNTDIQAAGFKNSGEMVQELYRRAMGNQFLAGKEEARINIDALLENPPIGPNGQPASWAQQESWIERIVGQGEIAGIPEDVMRMIAEGKLSGTNNELWLDRLDAALKQAQIDDIRFDLEQARATAANGGPAPTMTDGQYNFQRALLNDRIENNDKQYQDNCIITENTGGAVMGGSQTIRITGESDHPMAQYCGINRAENEALWATHRLLGEYHLTGDPNIGYQFLGGVATETTQGGMFADEMIRLATAMMDPANGYDVAGLQFIADNGGIDPESGKHLFDQFLEEVRNGERGVTEAEVNTWIGQLVANLQYQMDQETSMGPAADAVRSWAPLYNTVDGRLVASAPGHNNVPKPLNEVISTEGWRGMSIQERVPELEQTREWRELVESTNGGTENLPTYAYMGGERVNWGDMARQFGFVGGGLGLADVERLREALELSNDRRIAAEENRDRPVPIYEDPGAPTGPPRPTTPQWLPGARASDDPLAGTPSMADQPDWAVPGQTLATTPLGRSQMLGIDPASESLTRDGQVFTWDIDETYQRLLLAESRATHIDPTTGTIITSPSGAMGISQIMPLTAVQPGHSVTPLIQGEFYTPAIQQAQQAFSAAGQAYNAYVARNGKDTPEAAELLQARSAASSALHSAVAGVMPLIPEADYIRFGREYLEALVNRFGGDVQKAIIAYNAGAGTVNSLITTHGEENWVRHAPAESRTYIRRILGYPESQ